jgi:uncharacterized protein YndB with AHSA1/START domain
MTMVNVQAQVEAVSRGLRTEEVDGHEVRIQSLAQEYPSGIEDVWEAVTTADRIVRWFLPISGDLKLGGRYQLTGNAGGEVLACDPPADGAAFYRITWEFGGGLSWVTVRLATVDAERTRLELEHSARVAEVPAEMWDEFGPGALGVGWDGGLIGLALHLGAQDGAISPDEAAAWAVSDEGKAFYRAAADAWAGAHVAAGADEAIAARAADSTYGFYTGEPAA